MKTNNQKTDRSKLEYATHYDCSNHHKKYNSSLRDK